MIKDGQPSIKQGIFGQLREVRGNQMPSPDVKTNSKGRVLAKQSYQIYQVAQLTDAEGGLPLFNKINKTLVAKGKTDQNGYFQAKLPVGRYSIFVVINVANTSGPTSQKLFASLMDGNNEIAPVEVKPDQVTRYDVVVNYRAAY